MLDKTLVVWMGEFGRTPRINPRGGRDHYPRAFNVALAGGGMRGGPGHRRDRQRRQRSEERPVAVPDLFQTFCQRLKIDPDQGEHERHRPADQDRGRRRAGEGVVELEPRGDIAVYSFSATSIPR